MSEDFIPLAAPNVGAREAANLQACIDTTFVSSVGPFTTEFERRVAQATGSEGAVATSAGTTGLHAALLALGVGRDDLVIMPSFTFVASAAAVAHCGADPWLMDIDPATWLLDLDQVERELGRETERRGDHRVHVQSGRRVAAIMPIYTLGALLDLERQKALAARFGLPIVADAAAALGAHSPAGEDLAGGADLSVISFNGNKIATAGGGGAVVGDPALLAEVRHLTTTARTSSDYTFDRVGYNYRITNLQAAVGCAQVERLDAFVATKRRIRTRYDAAFADTPGVRLFPNVEGSNCWFSGLIVDDPRLPTPAELSSRLRETGVEARTFWKPVHLQAPYAHAPAADVRVTDALWNKVLTLPCSTALTDAAQDRVIAALTPMLAEALCATTRPTPEGSPPLP